MISDYKCATCGMTAISFFGAYNAYFAAEFGYRCRSLPIMSDFDFDKFEIRIRDIWDKHPGLQREFPALRNIHGEIAGQYTRYQEHLWWLTANKQGLFERYRSMVDGDDIDNKEKAP